jgi:hypothetical protein
MKTFSSIILTLNKKYSMNSNLILWELFKRNKANMTKHKIREERKLVVSQNN